MAGLVGGAEVDALAKGVGEFGDAAEEGGLEEEVVGAAVFVDGGGGEAEGAAEGEAEGLGNVAIEQGAGLGGEDEEVFADLVGEGELGGEARGVGARDGVEEVADIGGGADAELGDERAVLGVVDVAGVDALGAAEDVGLLVGIGAGLELPVNVGGLVAESELFRAGVGPADVGADDGLLELALGMRCWWL